MVVTWIVAPEGAEKQIALGEVHPMQSRFLEVVSDTSRTGLPELIARIA